MKVWNTGQNRIKQLYNSKVFVIESGEVQDFADDLAIFLLSKREVRGKGLVQLKEGDDKGERYLQGRRQVYLWAKNRCADYEMYCQERKELSRVPAAPHKGIKEYMETIKEYEQWEAQGFPMPDFGDKTPEEKKKVYLCPYCDREFDLKVAYLGHLRSHQGTKDKEGANDHPGVTGDKGKGKNR